MAPTIKARQIEARSIIDPYPVGSEFSDEDRQRFNDIVCRQFKSIKKMDNPSFPGDRRHIHVFDGEKWESFSWNKAISPASKDDVGAAMRNAVKDDMDDFRISASPQKCAHCKTEKNLSTDHVNPSFKKIRSLFIEMYGEPELEDWRVGAPKRFKDQNLEASWVAFHASLALYQLLCRSCNSKKGAR